MTDLIVLMTKTTKGYLETIKKTLIFEAGKSYVCPNVLAHTFLDAGVAVLSVVARGTHFYFNDNRTNEEGYRKQSNKEWEERQAEESG